jgi:hypothetical protein
MHKGRLWIPVLAGLMIGQLFAEGERPFKVINTVRVGYNDNINTTANGKGSSFVTDIIDLSFRAALSDRTDMMVKSQFNILTESGDNRFNPNLYVMLNHSISPRLLLRLSEYYRSGDKSGSVTATGNSNERYDYFHNKIDASADYVLTRKDHLTGALSHEILRHDKENDSLDYTTIGGTVSWKRDLVPQRTYTTLNLGQRRTTYDNRQPDFTTSSTGLAPYTNTTTYLDDKASDATDLSAGLNHTFNQQWQGYIEAGVTYVQPDHPDSISTYNNTLTSIITTNKADNSATLSPLFKAGLVYSPSPRTRLTSDLLLSYQPSDDDGYSGQNTTELRFGAQHDITAKLMAKATARFANVAYDTKNATTGHANETEERMDLALRLTYKLNRMNFLELGLRHSESESSGNRVSWEQNVVDIGWRLELN